MKYSDTAEKQLSIIDTYIDSVTNRIASTSTSHRTRSDLEELRFAWKIRDEYQADIDAGKKLSVRLKTFIKSIF